MKANVFTMNNPDEVAKFLRLENYMGDFYMDPLSKHITYLTGLKCYINDDKVEMEDGSQMDLTPTLKSFMKRFAEGYYPDLCDDFLGREVQGIYI